jgi:cyclase
MLKKRIIASVPILNQIVVQSRTFQHYLPIGKLKIALEFLSNWGIDEIVIVDISASKEDRLIDVELVKIASKKCQVPIVVGGGIKTLEDAKKLAKNGADKIVVNQLLHTNPQEVLRISQHFGKQFVIASVDIKTNHFGHYALYNYKNQCFYDIEINHFLQKLPHIGVGEILVNSVDRDGSYQGFDLELFKRLRSELPILFQGGAKNASSFIELFSKTSAKNAVAGNFFHFSEHSVATCKNKIAQSIDQIRSDQKYFYNFFEEESDRPQKMSDAYLENMLFEKIKVEVI